MQVGSIAEQLFFTTMMIEGERSDISWSGTGFIYAVETTAGTIHTLVTNKHVLDAATTITVRSPRATGEGALVPGKATQITVTEFGSHAYVSHPDPRVDVAVLPLAAVLLSMAAMGAPPFFRAFGSDLALSHRIANELDALEDVVFVGYPNGIYDQANFTPVARRGSTATPIALDYRGSPAFLIDASVFPGSSGSPVLILDRGMYRRKDGSTVLANRVIFLGVLAAVHMQQVEGTVHDLPAQHLGVTISEPIDLGIVYKATAVDECVDLLLGKHRISRVGQSPSRPGELTEADEELVSSEPGPDS